MLGQPNTILRLKKLQALLVHPQGFDFEHHGLAIPLKQ